MSRAASWLTLAGCSLLAGLAALASAARPAGEQAPAARLLVALPGPVIAVAATSAALAVLLLFVFVFGQGRRRRSPGDDETDSRSSARLRRSLRPIAALATLVVVVHVFWRNPDLAEFVARIAQLIALPERPASSAGEPAVSVPLFTGALAVLALCVGLGSLGVMLWIMFGERVAQWWAGDEPDDERHALVGAVEESLDDLRLEPDPRVAIIKCYRRFEQALARSEVPRAPWQTPLEFMESALSRLPLPPGAVGELTRLFELSRFSDHPLGPAARDAAWESLLEIKASLALRDSSVA